MNIEVNVIWDHEAGVWVATNDELGVVLEGGSLDALLERVKYAISEMLELNYNSVNAHVDFNMQRSEVIYG